MPMCPTARWLPIVAVLIIVAVALAGCQTCAPLSERTICPETRKYTKEQQIAMADELGKLPPGSMLGVAMVDYGELRKVLRACRGE